MTDRLKSLESRWNWRFSAHCRIASLASLWAVIFLMGTLGALVMPLAAVRTGASLVQTALNIRLGRKTPVAQQTKLDWALVASIFVGAEVAAIYGHFSGNLQTPLIYLPMLLPFSVLQWRMTTRSFAAYETQRAAKVVAFRLEKFQRTEAA